MALIGRYLFDSFQSPLPWTECKDSWINCVDPNGNVIEGTLKNLTASKSMFRMNNDNNNTHLISSSEYYFL